MPKLLASVSLNGKKIEMNENILSREMKVAIDRFIKIIEVKLAVKNTVRKIFKKEEENIMESLDIVLNSYKGRGKASKNENKLNLKTGSTGFCSIDALLNLFRNSKLKNLEQHALCNHKSKCALCIVRSALLKIETNKEKKRQVKLPEIEKNLEIFLGKLYCSTCYKPLEKNENHKCPLIKPAEMGIKHILDTFLKQPNVPNDFGLDITCKKCSINLNPYSEGYLKVMKTNNHEGKLSIRIKEMISYMQKCHTERAPECKESKVAIKSVPKNFLVMMETKTVTQFEKSFLFGPAKYHYAGHVSYNTGLLSNHFSTTSLTETGYVEYSERECKEKTDPDILNSVLMLYTQAKTEMPTADLRYKQSAIKFFSYDPENRRKKHEKEYDSNAAKEKYDPKAAKEKYDPENRQEKHKKEYDPENRQKKHKKEYDPQAAKEKYDPQAAKEKYDPENRRKKHEKEYDSQAAKEKYDPQAAKEKYDPENRRQKHEKEYDPENRKQKHEKEYDPQAAKEKRRQVTLKSTHMSGFQSICISCTRWGNNPNVIKTVQDIQTKFPKAKNAQFFLHTDMQYKGKWRMCATCYTAFKEGRVPKLNMKTLEDYLQIGAIPFELPKLNNLEAYLIKLRIPFLRLANMPRSPNLKTFGSMVCVSANIKDSIQKIETRLDLQHQTLIPVNFKRKLSFTGSYISKVIDPTKVFIWLDYLKRNNPLYADLDYSRETLTTEIKRYEKQLVKEAALFDEENKADSDLETDNDSSDDSSDDEGMTKQSKEEERVNLKEYYKEDTADSQDTLLIDVRQANLDEDSVTNAIADTIVKKEKGIFYSDDEGSDHEEPYNSNDEISDDGEPSNKRMKEQTPESNSNKKIDDEIEKLQKENISKVKKAKIIFGNIKKKTRKEKVLNVAPGEGGTINNQAIYGEAECFPELFPTGRGTYLSYVDGKKLNYSNITVYKIL